MATIVGSPVYLAGSISDDNCSTAPLIADATFTGIGDLTHHNDILVTLKTDVAGTLYIDLSIDGGSNYDTQIPFPVAAGGGEFHTIVKGSRTVRIRYINGSTGQSYFRLQTEFGSFRAPNKALSTQIQQDEDAQVVRTDDEDAVMRSKVAGEIIIPKFGRNTDVDTGTVPEDIWRGGGVYTGFPTTAAENFEVLSSSANDTSAGTGARTLRVYYYNDDYEMFDASGNFLYFDVTMNGTTGVDSGISGMRVWRAQVLTSGSSEANVGVITIRWITTTSVIFAAIPADVGQTEITNFTIPKDYKGYLKQYGATLFDTNANRATNVIRMRNLGSGTWRDTRTFSVSTTAPFNRDVYGAVEIAEKTDFIFRCVAVDNSNADINVDYSIRLVKN